MSCKLLILQLSTVVNFLSIGKHKYKFEKKYTYDRVYEKGDYKNTDNTIGGIFTQVRGFITKIKI